MLIGGKLSGQLLSDSLFLKEQRFPVASGKRLEESDDVK